VDKIKSKSKRISMSFETQDAKDMPTAKLRKHIAQFLKEQNMCVLATCSNGVPRATPIEYHSKGTTMLFCGRTRHKDEEHRE
jgi:nitroimidazol reductase NimA-like FMN-containing flavoprotein (pyridoxamine 5'-phosphate oxidase superfamily)